MMAGIWGGKQESKSPIEIKKIPIYVISNNSKFTLKLISVSQLLKIILKSRKFFFNKTHF